eukprot:TRINITY_DN15425_c0_g3_i1.p1 TRINITY_DN15425_c0_g3~~TRINITY_DN15425_c0_g3_i1.p1  ORF type:complete len:209 (+),score=37.69 TRINITY_DN15425_c0_g3_i1:53-628(+)
MAASSEADWKQQAAVSLAKEAGTYALSAASTVHEYIKRGPEGVGWLCWLGGLLTFVFGILGVFNIFNVLVNPLGYVINIYQMAFGVATLLIEAPKDWVDRSMKLDNAQKFVHEFAHFLTTFGGRGLFYLFQGSLTLSAPELSFSFLLAIYMFGLGALCIAMQYGLDPAPVFACFKLDEPQAGHHGDYIHVT